MRARAQEILIKKFIKYQTCFIDHRIKMIRQIFVCSDHGFQCFQAHRDEIVSMISNPKIDQVVSSGLGEYRFSISFI
jgi:hypothetical protein